MIELEKNEHIIIEVRRHWLVFVTEISVVIILAIVPLFAVPFFKDIETGSEPIIGAQSLFLFFYAAWLLIMWLVGIILWTNYFLDVWVITSKKIMDIDQGGLFKRKESFLYLDKIQDVTIRTSGLLPTLLNYGNIVVQTAGFGGEFLITGIPNPKFLYQKINEAIKINREELEIDKNKLK